MSTKLRSRLLTGIVFVAFAGACGGGNKNPTKPRLTREAVAAGLQEVAQIHAGLPRDRVDPAAIVATSREPAKLLTWVRDNTRSIRYQGSLRGPLGVLLDRSGNSLDRALLLAQLLKLAGHQARVVVGTLPSAVNLPLAAAPQAPDVWSTGKAKEAAAIASTILAKVSELKAFVPINDRSHYWVQFSENGEWIDADPSAGEIGKALARSEGQPMLIDAATGGLAMPQSAALSHTVSMTVLVERWEAGRLVETPLASIPMNAAKGPIVNSTVTFVPVDKSSKSARGRQFSTGAALQKSVLEETAWAVMISGDDPQWKMGRMFDDSGVVGDVPATFDATGMVGSRVQGAFGNAMDAFGGGDESQKRSVLTAVLAEYEIVVPGTKARKIRRYFVDLIGPHVRLTSTRQIPRPEWTGEQGLDRGQSLAASYDTLVTYASVPAEIYAYRYGRRMLDVRADIEASFGGSTDPLVRERALHGLWVRPLELFAALRDGTIHPALVMAEPQIVRQETRFIADDNEKGLTMRIRSDLTWNRLVPVAPVGPAVLVTQGVLDTLHESAITLSEPLQADESTAVFFQEAAKQQIELVVIRDRNDPMLGEFPEATRARMISDLTSGQVLLTASRPLVVNGEPRLAWWRVDPRTAQVVGAMDTGLLQETVKYVIVTNGVAITGYIVGNPRAVAWAQTMSDMRWANRLSTTATQFAGMVTRAAGYLAEFGTVPPINVPAGS